MPNLQLLVCDNCFIIRKEYKERKCPICEPGILRARETKYDIVTIDADLLQDTYKQIKKGKNGIYLLPANKYSFRDFEVEHSALTALHEYLLLGELLQKPFDTRFEKTIQDAFSNLFAKRMQILQEASDAIKTGEIDTVIQFMVTKTRIQKTRLWSDEFLQTFIDKYNLQNKSYLVCCNNCFHLYRYAGQPSCIYCGSADMTDFNERIPVYGCPAKEELLSLLFIYAGETGFTGFEKTLYAFLLTKYPAYSNRVSKSLPMLADCVAKYQTGEYSLADIHSIVYQIPERISEDERRKQFNEESIKHVAPPPPIGGYMAQPSTRMPYNNTPDSSGVFSSVYSPSTVKAPNDFLVQVFIYNKADIRKVEAIAKNADEDTKQRFKLPLLSSLNEKQKLEISLLAPGLLIDEPVQTCVWMGQLTPVQFLVSLPEGFTKTEVICSVIVSTDSLPIGHMKCKVKFVASGEAVPANGDEHTLSHLRKYRRVFISYATADRTEVLKRVQMLQVYQIDYFQDILSLEPGDNWEERIYKSISESDAFFLFWSSAAKQSEWVRKELIYALNAKKGQEDNAPEIIPILIEGPPVPEPPKELNFLHFNDRLLYFMMK